MCERTGDRERDTQKERVRARESESKNKIKSDGVDTVEVKMRSRRRSAKKSGRSRRTNQRNRPSLSRHPRSLCLCLTVAFSLCHVLLIHVKSPVYCMHMRIKVLQAIYRYVSCLQHRIGQNIKLADVTNNHNKQVVVPITRMEMDRSRSVD